MVDGGRQGRVGVMGLLEGKKVEMPPKWQTFKRAQVIRESGPVQWEVDL
jgi:hypothetical protein